MTDKEPITLRLSSSAHGKLQALKDAGYFREMQDGFRFGVALALAHGIDHFGVKGDRKTYINVGSLDADGSLYFAVKKLADVPDDESVYKRAEELAEWGITELDKQAATGRIDFVGMIEEADELA